MSINIDTQHLSQVVVINEKRSIESEIRATSGGGRATRWRVHKQHDHFPGAQPKEQVCILSLADVGLENFQQLQSLTPL